MYNFSFSFPIYFLCWYKFVTNIPRAPQKHCSVVRERKQSPFSWRSLRASPDLTLLLLSHCASHCLPYIIYFICNILNGAYWICLSLCLSPEQQRKQSMEKKRRLLCKNSLTGFFLRNFTDSSYPDNSNTDISTKIIISLYTMILILMVNVNVCFYKIVFNLFTVFSTYYIYNIILYWDGL